MVALMRGGQLVSWRDARGLEQLYLSPNAQLAGDLPVRGGVPVIFPQFGSLGLLPRHGLARLAHWEALENCLALEWNHCANSSASAHDLWPHDCHCVVEFTFLSDGLKLTLTVTNTAKTPLVFTAALHTYLAANSQRAKMIGLDSDGGPRPLQGPREEVHFDVPAALEIDTGSHMLRSTRSGFTDLVIWNPGPHHKFSDLPVGGDLNFVCVEAAKLTPVHLAAGESWLGTETWSLHT